MNCEVHSVYKNPRYRILVINDQTYILDLGGSPLKIAFPFLLWIFPNPVFKVKNHDIVEKLKTPEVKQADTGGRGLVGGGIAVLIAVLLRPFMDYFDIQSSPFINSIIAAIVVILVFILFFCISNKCKKNLYRVTKPEQLPTNQLWIRPKSAKHFFQVLFYYLFFLAFTALGFALFIEYGNVPALFFTILFLLFLLIVSIMTVMGDTTVKFKGGKKASS